jgi:hypothetical protein
MVVGGLAGAAVVAPFAAIPWLVLPALAIAWVGMKGSRGLGTRSQAIRLAALVAVLNTTAMAAATASGLRVSTEAFSNQDIRVNHLLGDIPLHDAWAVDLKGPASPTMENLGRAFRHRTVFEVTPAIAALGIIRGAVGAALGWGDPRWADSAQSFLGRLTESDRRGSSTQSGTTLGTWRVLYTLPREALVETINATVHVAVAASFEDRSEGARLLLAFRVRDVNWTTPLYMKLIDPARRYFIYPFLLRQFVHTWERGAWARPNGPLTGETP